MQSITSLVQAFYCGYAIDHIFHCLAIYAAAIYPWAKKVHGTKLNSFTDSTFTTTCTLSLNLYNNIQASAFEKLLRPLPHIV